MKYEIQYESATDSGTKFVDAGSDAGALEKFKADWREHGDDAPSCWIVGRWATT